MIVNSGVYPKVSLSYFCNVLIELDLFTEKQLSLLKNDDDDLDRSQFLQMLMKICIYKSSVTKSSSIALSLLTLSKDHLIPYI